MATTPHPSRANHDARLDGRYRPERDGSRSGVVSRAAAIGVIIGADQLTKWLAGAAGCGAVVCPVRNRELLLGTGPPDPPLILASVIGLVVFAIWVLPVARRSAHAQLAAAVGAGGITSNLLDRLLHGSVRDFLIIPGGFVINLADVAIAASLLCCALALWRRHRTAWAETASDHPGPHGPDDERR